MYDGAKSWVGDTHEPSLRAAVKDHGTKRRLSPSSPPESHLTQVRNLHHNWLLSSNKWNKNFGLLWLLCWLWGSLLEEYLDYAYKNQKQNKTISPQIRFFISVSGLTHLKNWLTWDKICFLHSVLSSGSFSRHFPEWREVRVKCAKMSEGPELGFLGSVDSRPKAPQELMGTCEGPSNVTWLGPFRHRQEGTMGGTCHFHHPHLGCSGQCFCKISAHLLNFYP